MSKVTIAATALAALLSPGPDAPPALPDGPNGAIALVRPIYEALTAASPSEVRARLEAATAPGWANCGSNDRCETREETIARWSGRISRVPDFRFHIHEILVSGNRVVVRSEATGAPSGPFMGVDPEGRSFSIMTLDVHEIEDGRVARTFHAEDWGRALRQLRGDPP